MSGELFVDRREAARRMGISVTEIDDARRRGDLACKKLGSKVLVPIEELKRFGEALPADEPRSA